jgi:hypothetical protein
MGLASSGSRPSLSLRQYGVITLASLAGMLGFLAASQVGGYLGFPLDDSWIHSTYARNLAFTGEWVYRPGTPSAGSTSPLWTFLLVPGYWLGLAPLWWSHLLGLVGLVAVAASAELGIRRLNDRYRPRVPWAGLLVGTEWHLVWASASGMETLLHAALITGLMLMLITGSRRHTAMGLLTGLCIWVRPDGLTIVPAVILVLGLKQSCGDMRVRALLAYTLGLGALLLPYFVFHLVLAGNPFPNTFYAKQAEYAGWQSRTIVSRLGSGLLQVSTSPALLLWPALGIQLARAVKERSVAMLAVLAWCGAYVALYVLRLPPYQHGRYLIPVMPVLLIVGVLGLLQVGDIKWRAARHWAVAWAWSAGLIMTQLAFLVLGARAYAQDVELIQTEMVATASWVARNLPPEAVVAAHDIGALGYLDYHDMIDLAGLVSPEVIPFLRDEDRLADYLDRRGASHLIAFPNLYPQLAAESRLVFSSGGRLAEALGQGNMSVYCWRCP